MMPYYLKQGALYRTRSNLWTWDKSNAIAYDKPQGSPPTGCFWSKETPPHNGKCRTLAAQHEAELTKDISKPGDIVDVFASGYVKPLREWNDTHTRPKEAAQ